MTWPFLLELIKTRNGIMDFAQNEQENLLTVVVEKKETLFLTMI